MSLLDARPLKLVTCFSVQPRRRAQSIYWHDIESRPCLCETLHGHCWSVSCPCGRHEGEISR